MRDQLKGVDIYDWLKRTRAAECRPDTHRRDLSKFYICIRARSTENGLDK
jgi:hypothetical protein